MNLDQIYQPIADEQYKDNLYWPREGGFYLYNDAGEQAALSRPKKKFSQKRFNFMHRNFLSEDCRAFGITKKGMSTLGAQKNKGLA